MGIGKLNLSSAPSDMPGKQAAAAVGQCELMYTYDKLFSEHNHTVAQILLTGDDVNDNTRHENFKNTINRLLELKVLPIINENDTVSTVEIAVGDNDTLAFIVSVTINADLLVLLSDIDGLYSADPRKDESAVLLPVVDEITEEIKALGGGKGSSLGTGGMHTKLNAAEICTKNGIDMIILAGFMCILSEKFTSRYPKRILNVHPSLIPSFCGEGFYGLKVHEAALAYGVKVTGATVHYVNEIADGGEIILQKAVDILPGDTPEVLQKRVMEQAEWILLPRAAELVAADIINNK
jgi:glutamate 5-kinase